MNNIQLTGDLVRMAIAEGMLDSDLDTITEVIRARRRVVATLASANLKPGDEFYIQNCSPQYMNGERVKLVKRTTKGLVCEVTSIGGRRWRRGETIILGDSHVGPLV